MFSSAKYFVANLAIVGVFLFDQIDTSAAVAAAASGTLVFHADFTKSSLSAVFGGAQVSYGNKNVKFWSNGTGFDVVYPAKSFIPSNTPVGGFGLFTNNPISNSGVFKYSVFFPVGFNFVQGGKLPGLYGGKTGCTGGDPAVDCFSTRLMWRAGGLGEAYLYANRPAQDQSICTMPNSDCNPTYGWSLSRGSFRFRTGAWNNVEEMVTLNTPGVQNGVLAISVNGVQALRYTNIVFRTAQYPKITISGMDIETFFGGHDSSYATPTAQKTSFKDFYLYSN